ncbi:hypothetical protein [Dactylosporangium sp. NPDC048998]|uniref:hypothetical protein n=1 Tax=Dactylosporangium sp. NPDC048998 TaxID=3363976 RepID=UPI00371BFFCE
MAIPGVGHRVGETAPEQMLAALTAFLTPYRNWRPQVHVPPLRGAEWLDLGPLGPAGLRGP